MKTFLFWGDRWWLPGWPQSLPVADAGQAAEVLAAHLGMPGQPVAIRLIWQPDGFSSAAVDCPNGNRGILGAALASERTALTVPDLAWSFEPIFPRRDRFRTLLHFEAQPQLAELVRRLEAYGIIVESAWPLATWLNALPADISESGAVHVCALCAGRAAIYRHRTDGERGFEEWIGDGAIESFGGRLDEIFAQNPAEEVLIAASEAESLRLLEARTALEDRSGVQVVTLPQALDRTAVIPRRHPAQLLPPRAIITAARLGLAASLAFLLWAVGSAGLYAKDCFALRMQGNSRTKQKQELKAEIAHLWSNAAEIASLRTAVQAASARPANWTELIRALSAGLPREAVFSSLRITSANFTASGWIAGGPQKSWDEWIGQLGRKEAPWHLGPTAPPSSAGRFALMGQFVT